MRTLDCLWGKKGFAERHVTCARPAQTNPKNCCENYHTKTNYYLKHLYQYFQLVLFSV